MQYKTVSELRAATGWTQQKFADYFGVTRVSVCKWEAGERKITPALFDLMIYKLTHEKIITPPEP